MRKKLAMLMASLFLVLGMAWAQAPVDSPEQAITGLLNRIGGNGAANLFEIVIDANLAENGKDVFVITSQNSKPCIKGNTQLSVATGINWYLNHYAHINLTWNNLTTDLSQVTLPLPGSEEKHVCNTTYRYDFNTCTFSYSMAFWTWERWQQEIDWMALHGINAPLNLVGLDVVTRKFLRELGVSENDINAYIAGPGFIAWFAMNNLEGWGGTINANDVTMNGNPDWWYTRQEQLCRNMLQRMRELGMQPVIPGFSGQVPNCIVNYSINGFSSGDVVNNGTWAGGYTRPDILKPNTESYRTFAAVYYKHLHEVMGVSELYSIDPFHEGSLPSGVSNETCYPNIMVELDNYYNGVSQEDKTKNNVDEQPKWIIQYWQGVPQSGAFSAMSSYGDRFIGLDLFSDAPGKAQWNTNYFNGRPYIFCMLHNFGGRSGMHGRLESTMNDYFRALAKGNNCKGIGATPEGTETNPVLYDMLFELPWMDVNNRPTADEWLEDYAYSRYGVQNNRALAALKNLKKSVWACPTDQQGTSEAVILARPNWTIGSVSSWSTAAIYWDTQDVLLAADELSSISDLITTADGTANYNYDFIDVVRQAMVDYAAQLLPLINAARNSGDNAEYTRLYQLYLQLMLDLDEMLSYDENFKLERWTSLARNIANEVSGTTENDRRWLEWNARTQVTVWSKGDTDLHDYSNRCWAGLIKDFHYKRWEKFFTTNGGSFSGGWFSGFEYPWTVDFTNYNYSTVTIPSDMTATAKAKQTFGNYFGRVVGNGKNYLFPMGVTTNAAKSDVVAEVYRGQTVALPLEIGKNVTISSVWVDLNNDGAASNNENLTVTDGNKVAIAADAAIGKTTAKVTYSDATVVTFNLALVEDITDARTVTAVAGANGSVAIEGTNELSVTNAEAVKMIATANTGYNFEKWTDAQGNTVSNDNPYIYYGKDNATFTANFIQDKWGVVACNGSFSGDIAGYAQFIHNLTLAYYNREPETILEETTAPTQIFNTVPTIINVPQGASFDIAYDNGSSDGLKYCYFRAFIDLNADGDFNDEGELLKEVGTNGAQNTAVCSNKINVLLPYDMPLGITHMRLRFDGAWDNSNKPSARGAKDASIRPVYEIIINVTEFSDKAAHITVASNNDDWGTAKVWTDETPDGSTRTEWDVTKGVEFFIAAEKASEDVEFLGWYDHYGRLLTTELEHSMYAREDATYTARFRKALEIDGWQFEYRTEPGSELRVKGELGSTAPVGGKMYYIYAKTNGGNYYLYNNNGSLATATQPNGNAYIWVATADGNYLTFENLAQSGKYIGYGNTGKGLTVNTTPVKLDISSTEAVTSDCVGIKRVGDDADGKYMVVKNDGSEFNRNSKKVSDTWCSDYVFTEVTAPDIVILTSVRQSGDHDLVIPETVEILGEQCKIVGFDNNLFKNNKDLWTISLPSTIEEMSNNKVFEGVVNGKGANASANSANYITTDLGTTLAAGEDWSISLTIEDNGNNFNQWGSALIATGDAPMSSTYGKGFQLYLQAGGGLVVKTDVDSDANKLTNLTKGSKFRVDIVYTHANTQLKVTATPLASVARNTPASASLTVTQDMSDFSVVSHAIPEGVNITNLEVRKGTEPDPFEGCTNLLDIEVAAGCENYYVNDETGALYSTVGAKLHDVADEDKAEEIRALGELINNTKSLFEVIATSIDPVGKATEITLSTTLGNANYIWCNAPQSGNEGNVGNLLDNTANTFFHSNWGSTTAPADGLDHHLTIENLKGIADLQFHYQARSGSGLGDYPKTIKVQGSNNGTYYDDIAIVHPRNANGGTVENGAEWTSEKLGNGTRYTYLRFMVTATTTNKNKDGHIYWHMAEFDLFKLTSIVEVASEYQELAGITNDEAANVYDNLVNALYVYNNGGTAEELQAAYDALEPLYNEVNDKKNALQYIKDLTVLIGNTEALINRIAASVDPVGKVEEIGLQAENEEESNYIWCNAPTANEGVANLLDGQDGTILHTAWNAGSVSAYGHYLLVSVDEADLYNFSFRYKARTGSTNEMNYNDIPSGIKVYGSNEKDGEYTELYTVSGLTQTSGYDWTSPAIDAKPSYRYLRFNVTANSGFWHMAEFDLFKLTSVVEVAPGYKTFGRITNEDATAAYDLMVAAQYLCNNGGTVDELETALNNLQAAYDALNTKQGKVLNGVYYINYKDTPTFIAYSPALTNLTGATEGYRMFDGTTDNVDAHHQEAHNEAIANKVAADELFTIVPNSTGTGYTISVQGLYMRTTSYTSQWCVQSFSTADADAGVYLVDETNVAGIFKLKSDKGGTQYVNDWGPVFGNDNHSDAISTFSFTPVTEYTITVPERGDTTFCLPFNVVLPEGVVAYDINDLSRDVLITAENLLVRIAGAGDILQAGTPVVVKAAPGDYTLEITMNSDGAKTSLEGSVLRGNFVKQTLEYEDSYKKFVLNGKVWEVIDRTQDIPANTCWVEAEVTAIEDDYIDMKPDFVKIGDWKFRYEHATNGIKLTHGAASGDGELVIASEYTVNGKSEKVVAISKDFLHGNEKITSVRFPATLTNLGFRDVEPMFESRYEGNSGDGVNNNGEQGMHNCLVFPNDPSTGAPFVVGKDFAWKLTLHVTIDDPNVDFNQWGSAIVSTKPNSLDDYYFGFMQIYMQKGHKDIIIKIDNADDRYRCNTPVLDENGKDTGELLVNTDFTFEMEHDGTGGYQVVVYYENGKAKMYNISASENNKVGDFNCLYYSLPEGIHVDVKFEKLISQGLFVGCTNLTEIKVDPANLTFSSCEHGVLYDKNKYYVMRIPEGGDDRYEIPSKVVKLYPGAIHGVKADIVLHSNPQIGVVKGHEHDVENAKFFLSLDDIDGTITSSEAGYGGARDFISTNRNHYQGAHYRRAPLAEGAYGTIVLPFVPTNAMNKYDFFKFAGSDETSFSFWHVDELEPNTPYLYKLKAEDERQAMTTENGLDVFEATDTFTVKTHAKYDPNDEKPGISRALGAYVNYFIDTEAANNKNGSFYYYYNITKEKFIKVTKKLTYRPYRALFVVTPEAGQAAPGPTPTQMSLRIRGRDGSTTEIDPAQVEGFMESEYYDLMGRRVLNPTNGVYIVNGKKIIVK